MISVSRQNSRGIPQVPKLNERLQMFALLLFNNNDIIAVRHPRKVVSQEAHFCSCREKFTRKSNAIRCAVGKFCDAFGSMLNQNARFVHLRAVPDTKRRRNLVLSRVRRERKKERSNASHAFIPRVFCRKRTRAGRISIRPSVPPLNPRLDGPLFFSRSVRLVSPSVLFHFRYSGVHTLGPCDLWDRSDHQPSARCDAPTRGSAHANTIINHGEYEARNAASGASPFGSGRTDPRQTFAVSPATPISRLSLSLSLPLSTSPAASLSFPPGLSSSSMCIYL